MAEYEIVNPFIVADESGNDEWAPPESGVGQMYHCPKCNGTMFEIVRSDHYETSARCPTCKIQFVIHDG